MGQVWAFELGGGESLINYLPMKKVDNFKQFGMKIFTKKKVIYGIYLNS